MTNRFDTSQQQQYISTYVPLPFDTIAALGEKANKNFETGKKAEADLGAIGAAIEAAPMYEEDKKNLINLYNTKIKTLVDEAKGDYGSKDFQAKANALINEFKNDSKVQAFKGTLEAYQNWKKAKLAGKSKDLDYTYEMEADGKTFKQKDVLKDGVYSNKITKYADWDQAAKESAGHIAASGGEDVGNLQNTRLENGVLYERTKTGWKGVSNSKVVGVAKSVIPNYASKEAGQHHLETILKEDFGFNSDAYNMTYTDIANKAAAAKDRINKGIGTDADTQLVAMKNHIDDKLYNHIYAANKHQEGMIYDKSIDDQIVSDPAGSKKGSGTDAENGAAIPLNQVVANPNPIPGLVNSEFKKANPNSVFSFNDNGVMNHVKMGDMGSINKTTYTDKAGKVWDPEHPPANWQYVVKPRTVTTVHLTDEERGVFVSNGGYEFRPSDHNYTRNVKKVPNSEIFNKQLNEVLSWGALTGQLDKSKNGIDQYNELLPKYEIAIKNEVLNSKYLPAATKDLQDAFSNYYFPKGTIEDGKVKVTEVGATANWLVDGKLVAPEELVGATFNGFASSNNPDDILITTKDGKHHIANMNDPTLKDNLRRLTAFQKTNHNNIMNPVANQKTKEQQSKEVMSVLDGLGNIALKNASDKGILTPELASHIQQYTTIMNAKIIDNAKDLEAAGYKYSSTYTDPKTNVVGISYINHQTGDTQVISYDSKNDMITKVPADIFVKNITQKTLGNWNANINNNSKESGVNFENQIPNK